MCITPRCEHTSKALRYGTHSQGISQFLRFYLHTPRSSAKGMNHTCLLPKLVVIYRPQRLELALADLKRSGNLKVMSQKLGGICRVL